MDGGGGGGKGVGGTHADVIGCCAHLAFVANHIQTMVCFRPLHSFVLHRTLLKFKKAQKKKFSRVLMSTKKTPFSFSGGKGQTTWYVFFYNR